MSHIGIALIEYDNKYLVIEHEGEHQFWWFKFRGIGARFDFGKFKKDLKEAFKISLEGASYDFIKETESTKESSSKTVFKISLSSVDVKKINVQIKKGKKWKWKNTKNWKKIPWINHQKNIIEEIVDNGLSLSLDKEFLSRIEIIQKAQLNNRLVIFAGAGVSYDSGVPLWKDLIKEMKEELQLNEAEKDYEKIPLIYLTEKGENTYYKKLDSILGYQGEKFNPIHKSIIDLNPFHIVTTNYDPLFEQAMEEDYSPYQVIKKDNDLPYSLTSNFLIKMHGDLKERNIILTEEDYNAYDRKFPLIDKLIKNIFASKVVLFVGFSFDDRNLKNITQYIKEILKDDFQHPYLFVLEPKEKHDYNLLSRKGIQVLQYHNAIEKYLKYIGKYRKKKELGSKGQQTFNFLEFIHYYDRYKGGIANLHIVDQMYFSLEQFSGLRSIPPKTVIQILPFRGTERASSKYSYAKYSSNYHLQTKNEEILLFLNKVGVKDGKIHYKDLSYKKNLIQEVENYEEKIISVFNHLVNSNIHCIKRKDDDSNENHNRITLYNSQHYNCNCIECLYYKFDFQNILYRIGNEKTENKEQLKEAYIHFKMGNFYDSYYLLKQLVTDSWINQDYLIYFICKYNLTHLKYFINGMLPSKEKNEIIDEIDKINLNEVIRRLPITKEVKKALFQIVSKSLFNETQNKINDYETKINNIYKLYTQEGNTHYGATYYKLMEESFQVLFVFYAKNLLFNDELSDFKKLVNTYWKGLIISYMTNSKYSQKLQEFHSSHLMMAILYANPKSLEALLKKYEVNFYTVEQNSLQAIIENAKNFFSSNYELFDDSSATLKNNKLIESQKKKSRYFLQKYRRMFNALLLILSYTKFKKDTVLSDLLTTIFFHVRVSDGNYLQNFQYFTLFASKQLHLFTDKQIEELIYIIIKDNILIKQPVQKICKAIVESKPNFKITSEELITKIIVRVTPREKWHAYPIQILPFWSIIHEDYQQLFLDYINKELANGYYFNKEFYFITVKIGAIGYNESNYFSLFIKNSEKTLMYIDDKFLDEKGFPFSDDFGPWNYLGWLARILFSHDVEEKQYSFLLKNKNLPLIVQWILDPENFKDEIKPEWILFFNDEIILKSLAKIAYIKDAIRKFLKENYNAKLSEIYFKYFA